MSESFSLPCQVAHYPVIGRDESQSWGEMNLARRIYNRNVVSMDLQSRCRSTLGIVIPF